MMVILPAWAMGYQIKGWYEAQNWLLFSFGIGIEVLQVWMLCEGAMMWNRARGVLPAPLPPLTRMTGAAASGAVAPQ
jgi:carbon starvation protein